MKPKKYRILSQEDKSIILQTMKQNPSTENLYVLSEKFGTSIKNLRRWLNEGVTRKPGCGRKKLNHKAEQELCKWTIEKSVEQGRRVRRQQLKEQAILLFNDENFKASKAWQDEFIRNFDIKYLVNEKLSEKDLLNPLQKQKFIESQQQRTKEEHFEDSSKLDTVKKEEQILDIQPIHPFDSNDWFVPWDSPINRFILHWQQEEMNSKHKYQLFQLNFTQMQLECATFKELLNYYYQHPQSITETKIESKQLKMTQIFKNDEPINAMDTLDLNPDQSLILQVTDYKIKLYIQSQGKLNLVFYFQIKLDITDDNNNYDIYLGKKEQNFLKECRKSAPLPTHELLLHCRFAYIKKQVYLLAAGELGFLYLINLKNEPSHSILEGHHNIITDLSSNDDYLFSSSKDGSIIQWSVDNKFPIIIYRNKNHPDLECLCLTSNQDTLIGAFSDGFINIWTIHQGDSSYWNQQTVNVPEFRVQTPYSDMYPQITQIYMQNQTVLVKHLNGLIDYFFLEKDQVYSIFACEMSDNNYWEHISFTFPYLAFTSCERLQVYDVKQKQLIYFAEIEQIVADQAQIIMNITPRLVIIASQQSYTILQL